MVYTDEAHSNHAQITRHLLSKAFLPSTVSEVTNAERLQQRRGRHSLVK